MRAKKIEILLSYAGNEHRYQYFVLFIFLFLWANCNFISVALPYLEREPLIKYYDSKNIFHEKESLSYEKCSYEYEIIERFEYSWVNEFGLECDKCKIGLIGVFAFIGNTLGGIVFCFVQKYISHKKILVISSAGFMLSIFLNTFVNKIEYIFYLYICLLFTGLFSNCLCYSSLVICQEIISSNKRSLFCSIINMGYGLCGIIYSFIFMYIKNWKYDFYILILLSLFNGILICIFVYDSPRIYIEKGEIEKMNKILECVSCFNGLKKEFLEKSKTEEYKNLIKEIMESSNNKENKEIELIDLNEEKQNEPKKDKLISKNNKFQKSIFISLKYPSLRYKFLILCFLWFGTRATSNCIALFSKTLSGNYYFNIIVSFIFESLAYCVSGFLINMKLLGRKGTLWMQYIIIIISFLILSLANISKNVELYLNFICRFATSAIELVFYTYTLEVYPTQVRCLNFGINVTFGNIGSVVSPLIYEYLPSWIFLVSFAILTVFHSFLLIFLPETEGKPMNESIEELCNKNEIDNDNNNDDV